MIELKKSTGEEQICTLIFDEMYIKKQVYWDQYKFQYVGYPTFEYKRCKKTLFQKGGRNALLKLVRPIRTLEELQELPVWQM